MSVVDDKTSELYAYEEQFRDHIGTVDSAGKRIWVYPKKPAGHYHALRVAVTVLLLGLLLGGPFITVGGQPLFLLNIFDRKFVLFGLAIWPQDFVLIALSLLTFFVFIILFTVVFGRIWCGWMCPQTLFMEMVFRKIEYWIEGDANDQRRLDREAWSFRKVWKKGLKHLIFILISVIIAHTVMSYLVGVDAVIATVQNSPSENWAGFIGITAFTGIFYYVFAFFREQVCIAVCPYGRLQGVLLNKDSISVAYDSVRGEPRGKLKKGAVAAPKGDCIDCRLCVHVCPTGIDIRNGTQLECVNCTACIDACDDVMVKIGKPKGLIRFASLNSIQNRINKLFTPRVWGYTAVLVVLVTFLSFMVATRTDVETTVLKVPGTLYQKKDNGIISNLYNAEFVNKTFNDLTLDLRIESPSSARLVKPDSAALLVPGGGFLKVIYFLEIPEGDLTSMSTSVRIGVFSGDKKLETISVKFVGPITKLKQP